MERYLEEWEAHTLYEIKKDILRTLMYIHENKGRDCNKALSSQQLDDVKDATMSLCNIAKIRNHTMLMEESEHRHEHEHEHDHVHTATKATA